jgi:ribonucleoside-diphosphate reductase alpha chain
MDGDIYRPHRRRLLNRRRAETRDIEVAGMKLSATIGLDIDGSPRELFLSGAKDGSTMAAILADASVVVSIALQHGISPHALAKSISRAPDCYGVVTSSSVIGRALDLITKYEERNA